MEYRIEYGTPRMTLREYYAGEAMKGMRLATGEDFAEVDWDIGYVQKHIDGVAKMALMYADALIARLEEDK